MNFWTTLGLLVGIITSLYFGVSALTDDEGDE